MDSIPGKIAILFELSEELHEPPKEYWQFLLWIMADFTIRIDGRVFFSTPFFTVVELAAQYCLWRSAHPDADASFVFTSMEADEPLLFITPKEDGLWLTSPWERDVQKYGLRKDVVTGAFDQFVLELENGCRSKYGLEIAPVIHVVGSSN
jgi:hypothetical protein